MPGAYDHDDYRLEEAVEETRETAARLRALIDELTRNIDILAQETDRRKGAPP